jgi:hypothetical protein
MAWCTLPEASMRLSFLSRDLCHGREHGRVSVAGPERGPTDPLSYVPTVIPIDSMQGVQQPQDTPHRRADLTSFLWAAFTPNK